MSKKHLSAIISFLFLFMSMANAIALNTAKISYNITFPEAQAHYTDVEMNITGLKQKSLELKMPVWTPGSYLVREFAKNIETLSVFAGEKALKSLKINKNTWKISTEGIESLTIKYRVYCFENSVRTSFVDASHAFLSPTGIFLYPTNMLKQPATIHIVPYNGWKTISTSLAMAKADTFTRHSPNYDILFDSPIEIGTQDVFGFEATGVKYEIAMCGGGNYDRDRLKKDMAKIVEHETAVFGENPNKYYVFIIHNGVRGGGGIEHLSSTTLGVSRENYSSETGYQNFLGLVAHEHFHLWNVKRLRPIALGPFNYDVENYTSNLWIAEGFTAYYQNLILRYADLYPAESFLTSLAGQINNVENQPGAKVQTLAESSYDAWIKAYRPNENSINNSISYYDKGAVVGLLLDLEIINNTNGKFCLNDVMKYMYNTYYKQKKRGYTDGEFKKGLEKFAGKSFDEFYGSYINGLTPLDFNKHLNYAGYKLTDELAESNDPSLGVNLSNGSGKKIVTAVFRGGAGWVGGLNVNDELTSIDGNPIGESNTLYNGKKTGDTLAVAFNRDGMPLTLKIKLQRNSHIKYKIEPLANVSPHQLIVRKKWLMLKDKV